MLLFMRHGRPVKPKNFDGPDDDRPLTARGVEEVSAVAGKLATMGHLPDVVLSSPKLRCLQTGQILARAAGCPMETMDELLGHKDEPVDPDKLARMLSGRPEETVAVVGHRRVLSRVFEELTGDEIPGEKFPKGAVVAVDRPAPGRPDAFQFAVTAPDGEVVRDLDDLEN